jgi:mannose-6-phosphate isomerase-like protein (cupin superfamily)
MKIHVHETEIAPGAGGLLIGKDHGATSGFCMGVSFYASIEYGKPGIHEDQEGFYILEGTGTAKVGDQEFAVRPGLAFIANKGVPHTMKRDAASKSIKVLWCHGAV